MIYKLELDDCFNEKNFCEILQADVDDDENIAL
jgi:hypothetical protein